MDRITPLQQGDAAEAGGWPTQAWFWLEWGSSELDREIQGQTKGSQ